MNNITPFTIHVRLTKHCNADCSYCSSWQESPDKRMSPKQFKRALIWLIQLYEKKGIKPTHVTVEYLGGEILTIPSSELKEIVFFTRNLLSSKGMIVNDGVQTNLIGSNQKVMWLNDLFEGRIGTSIDSFGKERTIKGSHEKYISLFNISEESFKHEGMVLPAVCTITNKNIPHIHDEIERANQIKRNLTIRPLFKGGLNNEEVSTSDLTDIFIETFENWFLKMDIRIDPIFSLFRKLFQQLGGYDKFTNMNFCPFQNDCASVSLAIEPNGDFYICQEMADSGVGLLGNALSKDFDENLWKLFDNRKINLEQSCQTCEFLSVCQGGCMLESIQSGDTMYGRTQYCSTWKSLLGKMRTAINSHDHKEIISWLEEINT